eukprot:GFUD01025535.1.p1 GENE.GFUD01025535.1~~GFUD01025535.1.p1  ORF type:complete len:267 (-),score=66.84 GFUD01025535.1:2-802(-)
MAELPSLGQHCALPDCNLLDFLPITCHFCKNFYCKEHFLPEVHKCPKIPVSPSANLSSDPPPRYECSVQKCSKAELAPVYCPECSVMVCLSHRHQSDHSCSKLVIPVHSMSQTKAKVEEIINSQPTPVKMKKLRSVKAQKTAAKVQLMKLKMKSTGDKSLPQTERVYFLVTPPKETGKGSVGVWVSNRWVMGRVVDSLAASLGVKNENNVVGKDKVKLFRAADGKSVCEDMSEVLEGVVTKEDLFNGDSVILEYVKDNAAVIEIES